MYQGRYKAFLVEDAGYYWTLSRYIHWNPCNDELSICCKAVGCRDLSELAEKLTGDDDLQLRIALPFASATIEFKMSPSSARASQDVI